MEAPEKLYFNTSDINGILDIYSNKDPHDSLEYTRTEVFIDKACDWIEDHIYEYLRVNKTWHEPDYNTKLINDFRRAMEGE